MRILVFTNLYPNHEQPRHGIFVETRIRKLADAGNVQVEVVAPVPWFPSRNPVFGTYARYARIPRYEVRHGIPVHHPRYPVIPKLGMSLAPLLMGLAAIKTLNRIRRKGFDFDVIDAHFFYPDGIAAMMAGIALERPVVITARGSDINLYSRYSLPRRWILWAAHRASGLVTVSNALKDRLLEIGVPTEKIRVLRNGVDTSLFQPSAREAARAKYEFDGFTVVSVGNLVPEKGHDLVIKAIASLSDAMMVIVGDGPEVNRLRELVDQLGVSERAKFLDVMSQEKLSEVYSAADLLVLASTREGWPNVLLEAMACGTPVVATSVGGVPEIVRDGSGGIVLEDRSVMTLAKAIRKLREGYPSRASVTEYAQGFGWDCTIRGLRELLESVVRDQPDTLST